MKLLPLALSALYICAHSQEFHSSYILYEWKTIEFNVPALGPRNETEGPSILKSQKAIPIDIQPYFHRNTFWKVFVTVPRLLEDVPYTLAKVSSKYGDDGRLLKPYPNYKAHNNNNKKDCDLITSAFRMAITECNQMWVIDSGMVGSEAQCPPQLLLFDLNTDKIIHRYRFSTSVYKTGASLFTNLIVDVKNPPPFGDCSNANVYVADSKHHGLVVYDLMQLKAWRIEDLSMYPDPHYGALSIANEFFFSMDGIYGMATDNQYLYFHPLSSATEYKVPLRVIDSSLLSENKTYNFHTDFKRVGFRHSSCAASAMDSNKNLFCVTLNPIELLVWNVETPYEYENIFKINVAPDRLQFVSSMKVAKSPLGYDELWMLSSKYQKIAAGTQDFNDINFRIVMLKLLNLSPPMDYAASGKQAATK